MNLGPSTSSGGAEKDKDSLWYFTAEQLADSPSRKNGIDSDLELSYRQMTAYLIQEMGQRLQVSQLCINTAIVYMHRFYAFHSFTHFHRNGIAAASLFLAAKVEEQPRKLEHVIKAANKCLQQPPSSISDQFYVEQAQDLVVNENVLLQTLGFDVAIDHPHTHVVKTCQLVKACKDLAQTSYFLASNSLHLTSMCLQYKPTVVACFCIYLACKWSRWEIPQSTEGRHWFYYVDKTVTMDLLKQLTDEFIAIYEKSPARLKSKLNSIKALAQGASNRVISKEKRYSQEDWKMGDMMKMYHSSINTNEPNSSSGNHGPYGRQPVDPNLLALLLPPMPPQQMRKPDMHASQSRSHHSSSTHHAKMAFPSGDIPGDHKSNHKQQAFSGGPLQRSREHPQGHQSMLPLTNLQRTNVGGSSGSGRPSSAGNLPVQSNQRSSTQSHPTDAGGYQKARDRTNNSGSMPNNPPLHMNLKLGQKHHDGSRNVSKDAMGKLNEQSKHTSKQMYSNPQLPVPHFNNNQLQSVPPSGSKHDPTHDLRLSGHRNYVGGDIRPSTMPPNYHQAQLDRANQNSKLEQQKMSYHHSHKQIPSMEQTFVPGNQENTMNPPQLQHTSHIVPSDYASMRPPENVPSDDHTNLFSGAYNVVQQQQHAKQNSIFSPEWDDKVPQQQQQQQPPQNLLIGNESLAKPNVDPYAFKSSSSTKDSPKKSERDRSTGDAPLKKEKTKNNMHLATATENNPLILSISNKSQSQQQHKFNATKAKMETSPQLSTDHNTNASSSTVLPGLKRPIDTLNKYDDSFIQNNNKLRKVENIPQVPPFTEVKPLPDVNKHQVINGIETNPDMVKSLLKETLCVQSLLLNESSNTVNEAMDIDNSTNVSIEPPAVEQSGDKQQSSVSKSEKKKKKDKHKHKEKDKDKSKDREERKKHKKDKDKHKEKEREVDNPPPTAHVKIKITKEKVEAASGSGEQPIFKIKIPKERITGDINIGGGGIGNMIAGTGTGASSSGAVGSGSSSSLHSHSVMHTASSTMPYTPALKIKISKDKLDNYNSGSANLTVGTIDNSSNPTTSTYTTQQLPSTSTGHSSSGSGSSKKKDRDRDRERDKEKKRSSHDFSRSNGGTSSSSGSSKSHHQNK